MYAHLHRCSLIDVCLISSVQVSFVSSSLPSSLEAQPKAEELSARSHPPLLSSGTHRPPTGRSTNCKWVNRRGCKQKLNDYLFAGVKANHSNVTDGPGASLLSQPASVAASHCGVCSRKNWIQRRQAYEVSVTELERGAVVGGYGPEDLVISKSWISKSTVSFTVFYFTLGNLPLNYFF